MEPRPPADAGFFVWLLLAAVSGGLLLTTLAVPDRAGVAAPLWLFPVLWLLFVLPAAGLLHGPAFRARVAAETADGPDPAGSPLPEGRSIDAGTDRVDTPRPAASAPAARSLWIVLAAGVGLSLLAAVVSGAAAPSVWPGAVMFMLLLLARPAARPAAAPAA